MLSPDGRMLAFDAADAAGKKAIWLRPLDALSHGSFRAPLRATPDLVSDSRSIAFMAGKLRRVAVAGAMQTIGDAQYGADGA